MTNTEGLGEVNVNTGGDLGVNTGWPCDFTQGGHVHCIHLITIQHC